MTNKPSIATKRNLKILLISMLLIISTACQNTKPSSYETTGKLISYTEVQAYYASIKHYFNPH